MKLVGMEVEGIVLRDGQRVDIPSELGLTEEEGWTVVAPNGCAATIENGRGQLEIVTPPFESEKEGVALVDGFLETIPRDWEVHWVATDPSGLPVQPFFKPRHLAIEEMVRMERGVGGFWMSGLCATHVSMGIQPDSPEGTWLLSALTHLGPAIARLWEEPGSGNRIGRAWVGWGDPSRLPAYRWFASPEDLRQQWRESKRAVTLRDGKWVIDDRTSLPEWGDPEHQGTRWWGVRPNGIKSSSARVEFRFADAMHPLRAVKFAMWLKSLANNLLSNQTLPLSWTPEEWVQALATREDWEELIKRRPEILAGLPPLPLP